MIILSNPDPDSDEAMADESELEDSSDTDNDEDDDNSMWSFIDDEDVPPTPSYASWHHHRSQDSMDSMEIENDNSSSDDIIQISRCQSNRHSTEQAPELNTKAVKQTSNIKNEGLPSNTQEQENQTSAANDRNYKVATPSSNTVAAGCGYFAHCQWYNGWRKPQRLYDAGYNKPQRWEEYNG